MYTWTHPPRPLPNTPALPPPTPRSQAMVERDPLSAARRGLLFAVLGAVLCAPDKCLGEDTLFALMSKHLRLPESAWGGVWFGGRGGGEGGGE